MQIKLMELNTQDLFLRLEYPLEAKDIVGLSEQQWLQLGKSDEPLKPLGRLRGLARVFAEEQPDIAILSEIGGEESLNNFVHLFLADAYVPYFKAGATTSSSRGIECAFLLRKGLALRAEMDLHYHLPVSFLYPHEVDPEAKAAMALRTQQPDIQPLGERFMSRNVPELRLYLEPAQGGVEQASSAAPKPFLILLAAHLKSQIDSDRIDERGAIRRAAEMLALLQLRSSLNALHGSEVPVIIAGDMNDLAAREETAPAFTPLYQEKDLEDALEVAGRASYERITHVTFAPNGDINSHQLDYIFLPRQLHAALVKEQTLVYRYRFEGASEEVQMPISMRDRSILPSDHYPLICVLDI